MHFFLTYLKTWKAGILSLIQSRKSQNLNLFLQHWRNKNQLSSKRAKESEETSLGSIKVAICVPCGDWVPTKSPMLHCRACKNRNDFDVYELAGFKKVEEIRIEY